MIFLFSGKVTKLNSGFITIAAVLLGILSNRAIYLFDRNKEKAA
jgi:hypothetical protein